MSELASVLELFGFLTIDEVTVDSLKKSFKTRILQAHPDKGGDDAIFDKMLRSYVYLTETLQRISGGRATLQNIVSPDELKEMRPDEIVNKFFEEFHNDEFNRRFEEQNKRETHGYSSWLKDVTESGTTVTDGLYGDATQKAPEFDKKDLNEVFEESAKKGKVEPSSIILHPEAMAYVSATCMGTLIIDDNKGSYTSDIFANPEYTDVYSAFTENNTICDKVTSFVEKGRTLEDIIAERNADVIQPLNDNELSAIQEFERVKNASNISNLSKVKEYYNSATNTNSNLEDGVECSGFSKGHPPFAEGHLGFVHTF
jgi:curved DNA-binding protein CbpA